MTSGSSTRASATSRATGCSPVSVRGSRTLLVRRRACGAVGRRRVRDAASRSRRSQRCSVHPARSRRDRRGVRGGPWRAVGVRRGCAYPEHGDTAVALLHLADGALFHAKETGKARVVVYDAARVPDLSAHERIERLERSSRIAAVRALAAAVDARDPDTRFHAQRVASLSVRLANYSGAAGRRGALARASRAGPRCRPDCGV